MQTKVRFAPSPTSQSTEDGTYNGCHCGSIRTILYNWLFAKQNKDNIKCIRVEDTDQGRSSMESLRAILEDMIWLDLLWDEGPTHNTSQENLKTNQIGDHGPYFQSQRQDIYNKYIDILIKKEMAYEKEGAIYFKMPKEDVSFIDGVLGKLTLPAKDCQDFVIRKTSGMPSFYFSNVIDDVEMKITHVFRGFEHINSAYRQIAVLKALNLPEINYFHLPIILNEDGSKMSKRDKERVVNVRDFRAKGYIPDAFINYMALCGCGFPKEIMSMDDMVSTFKVENIGKSNSKFDYKKLLFINQEYMKNMEVEILVSRLSDFVEYYDKINETNSIDNINWAKIIPTVEICKEKCKTLLDLKNMVESLIGDKILQNADLIEKVILKGGNAEKLNSILEELALIDEDDWCDGRIIERLKYIAEYSNVTFGELCQILRIAVTGTNVSPPIDTTLEIIGREICLNRLRDCIEQTLLIGIPKLA